MERHTSFFFTRSYNSLKCGIRHNFSSLVVQLRSSLLRDNRITIILSNRLTCQVEPQNQQILYVKLIGSPGDDTREAVPRGSCLLMRDKPSTFYIHPYTPMYMCQYVY